MSATELERLEPVLAELRRTAPAAPERLRSRVLEPAAPRRRSRRRLAVVLVGAAVALAVAAAVVRGLTVSSGPPATATRDTLQKLDSHAAASGGTTTTHDGVRAAPPAVGAPTVSGSRLQHVDATLQVQVGDTASLQRATSEATRIATSLGGWAQSVDYGTSRGGGGNAVLDLRIPVAKMQVAVARLSALGTLLSQQLDQQDLQQQLAAETARIAQLRRRVAALEKAVADPALPAAQKVLLRIQLSEARRSLTQAENQRQGTTASGATADVSLTLSTKPKAGAAVHHRDRLGRMIHSAVDFLALEAMVVFYVLVVTLPIALLAWLGRWLVRERRRRGERTLLEA